ncbi:MAG: S-methyl-5-thioribose-1-phosphate isomerase [Archaeoglobi archaeon]|jgi:methylthioribose-1-phosphate isomerase|nr:S-methyl-5-thioribose-1-phosphate isomerase [Archaeoglobus sp.]TDA26935.1 MAG: S-methyl-5-thioribose-1-phosphate isomerase [Archaeoglobi archaeon]
MRTIFWDDGIWLLDQTKLPEREEMLKCKKVEELVDAIKKLAIRGAPALEAAGAYGVALACFERDFKNPEEMKNYIKARAEIIANARPTAVNLAVGVQRVLEKALNGRSVEEIRKIALEEAEKIASEDIERNRKIGKHGAKLLNDGDSVLTYCNTGRLATVDWGTALGIIRSAIEEGKKIKVFACETRPLNQGSRLTCYELMKDGIEVTLITDSAAGIVMRKGMVNKVIVGADRIVRDGVFNKIGTYSVAIIANYHKIPFYVAAPKSTFDLKKSSEEVVIEERGREELIYCGNKLLAPRDVKVYNPAFDFTPLSLVSAIVTEEGILFPPYKIFDQKA